LVAETIEELRSLSTEEIIRRHDELTVHTVVGTQHYLDELARRDAEAQGRRMEALTQSITYLTWAITIATFIGVALTAWSVLSGA
jgi:hypothetical protein